MSSLVSESCAEEYQCFSRIPSWYSGCTAANAVHNDFGLNADHMADIHNDLLDNDDAGVNLNNDWEPWPKENQADNAAELANLVNEDQQQESISFDQSGSSSPVSQSSWPRYYSVCGRCFGREI